MNDRERACALQAIKLYADSYEAAEMDAGFDAGEFSGPAHDRLLERRINDLAYEYGFSVTRVYRLMYALEHELEDQVE
jgi:hypothetical protein